MQSRTDQEHQLRVTIHQIVRSMWLEMELAMKLVEEHTERNTYWHRQAMDFMHANQTLRTDIARATAARRAADDRLRSVQYRLTMTKATLRKLKDQIIFIEVEPSTPGHVRRKAKHKQHVATVSGYLTADDLPLDYADPTALRPGNPPAADPTKVLHDPDVGKPRPPGHALDGDGSGEEPPDFFAPVKVPRPGDSSPAAANGVGDRCQPRGGGAGEEGGGRGGEVR